MDFSIPEELRAFVDVVRRFRERELMPLEHDFLLEGRFPAETRTELEQRARRQGLWALDVPEEYGGQGIGALGACLVGEELFKHPAMFEFGGSPEPVLYACTEEQKHASCTRSSRKTPGAATPSPSRAAARTWRPFAPPLSTPVTVG